MPIRWARRTITKATGRRHFQGVFVGSIPTIVMDLLDESMIPEHARAVKQEAREFAAEHIEPNSEEYFERG